MYGREGVVGRMLFLIDVLTREIDTDVITCQVLCQDTKLCFLVRCSCLALIYVIVYVMYEDEM